MPETDFGRYLQSVEERDVDLLLMEEFHIDAVFVAWFTERVGLGPHASFDGAWHSLSDRDGETDLLLRVRIADERIALLIENKIAAPEQKAQDLRYHLRGARAQEAGLYDRFVTAICAPQVYLDGLPPASAYQHRIPYEALRDWYARHDGARAAWRRAILNEAIDQGRRGYVMKVHAAKTEFQLAYWTYLQRHRPELSMNRPGPKGAGSDWIYLRTADLPKDAQLVHKNDQGRVDLMFPKTRAVDLARERRDDWPGDVQVMPRGQSAALSLPVPRCDMEQPFAEQISTVEVALNAALKLAPLADALAKRRA